MSLIPHLSQGNPLMTDQDRGADRLALADRIRAHIGTIAPKCSLPVGEWNDIAEDFYEAADQLLAHPAASQGGVPGCGVPGCNDPDCDYGQEPAPSRPAAQPMREAIEEIPSDLEWIIGKGKTRPDEPLYGIQLRKAGTDVILAESEHDDLTTAIRLAIAKLAQASANEVKP